MNWNQTVKKVKRLTEKIIAENKKIERFKQRKAVMKEDESKA